MHIELNRAYCSFYSVQAFTHASASNMASSFRSRVASYKRLEFLGDAILNYLFAYSAYYHLGQNRSTFSIKSCILPVISNNFFAEIVVKFDLHKYIRCDSTTMDLIHSYVNEYRRKQQAQFDDISYII